MAPEILSTLHSSTKKLKHKAMWEMLLQQVALSSI